MDHFPNHFTGPRKFRFSGVLSCRAFIFLAILGLLFASGRASATCGLYRPLPHKSSWQPSPQIGSPRLVPAGLIIGADDDNNAEPTMVGLWKEHWISRGSEGIPDGAEVDAGYSQWHSDGTETNLSGLRSPLIGDVCLGVWEKTGARTYRLNHFGVSYDSTGLNLVGPARIQQHLTLDPKGDSFSGTFTIDQYDESGNLLAHVQGKITGTRVTVNTGFQKVE